MALILDIRKGNVYRHTYKVKGEMQKKIFHFSQITQRWVHDFDTICSQKGNTWDASI